MAFAALLRNLCISLDPTNVVAYFRLLPVMLVTGDLILPYCGTTMVGWLVNMVAEHFFFYIFCVWKSDVFCQR